jgi:hypothetical protein
MTRARTKKDEPLLPEQPERLLEIGRAKREPNAWAVVTTYLLGLTSRNEARKRTTKESRR